MDRGPTPRVNASLLSSFVGMTVRLVGRVASVQAGTVVLESSDGQRITIQTPKNSSQNAGGYQHIVEILGVLNPDFSIREVSHTNFGPDFDLDNYDELVKLSQQPGIRDIFME